LPCGVYFLIYIFDSGRAVVSAGLWGFIGLTVGIGKYKKGSAKTGPRKYLAQRLTRLLNN
jgi:hypothetical protein